MRKITILWIFLIFVGIVTWGAIYGEDNQAEGVASDQNQILLSNVHVFDVTTGLMSETQANIVILDKNPLEDIDNIKSTSFVVMNGKVISD